MTDHESTRAFHRAITERIRPLLIRARLQGDTLPCRAGCSACCYEPVLISREEAALLADRVRALPDEEREAFEASLRATLRRLEASATFREDVRPDAYKYRALRIPCPFLTGGGRCSVYEDRPGACRLHWAKSRPELCFDDRLRREQQFLKLEAHVVPLALEQIRQLGAVEFDYLPSALARELLGTGAKSRAAVRFEVDGPIEPAAGY